MPRHDDLDNPPDYGTLRDDYWQLWDDARTIEIQSPVPTENIHIKVLKLKDLIRAKFASPTSYMSPSNPNSVMEYGIICQHDVGFLCQCRLDYLIELINENL